MAQIVQAGKSIYFEYTAGDLDAALFVAMKVYDLTSGTPVLDATVGMTHVFGGMYTASHIFAADKVYLVHKAVYTTGSYAVFSNKYSPGSESLRTSTLEDDVDLAIARIGVPGTTLVAAIAAVQASASDLQSKVGTPAGASLSVDVANLKSDLDGRIGNPVGASISADLQDTKTAATAGFLAVQNKLGTPVGASVSADIAASQSELDARIGTPAATSIAADIANFRSETDARIGTPYGVSLVADVRALHLALTAYVAALETRIGTPASSIAADIADVKNQVWDLTLAPGHVVAGSAGAALKAASEVTPVGVAAAVWNALQASHTTAGTFGILFQAMLQDENSILALLQDPAYGLAELLDVINTKTLILQNQNTDTQDKVDDLTPALSALQTTILDDVGLAKTKVDTLANTVASNQISLITQFNQVLANVATVDGKVSSLNSGTTAAFVVPDRLLKPSVGTKAYEFNLRLYDETGVPENADALPTVTIKRLDTSTLIVTAAPMTALGPIGAYAYTFNLNTSSPEAPLLVEVTYSQDSVSRSIPQVTEITQFESDLTSLEMAVSAMSTTVTGNNTLLINPTYGLSALKNGETSISSAIGVLSATLGLVKAKTDVIPATPATQADTQAVTTAVNTRPTLAQIQTALSTVQSALAGPDARNLSQVYDNQPDLGPIAKTADPRFANLDATVSSRSTLIATQVWAAATRSLTSDALTPADIAAVWAYIAGAANVPNSIGKRIADFLDVSISSRATQAQVTALLSGVAQDATVSALSGQVASGFSGNQTLLNALQALATAIKAKTDTIPNGPATNVEVQAQATLLAATLNTVNTLTAAIKAKTDTLPANIATALQVAAIPTNPVLDSDVRLARLDQPVSSRAAPSDLSPLATAAAITAAQSAILASVAGVNGNVANLPSLAQIQSLLTGLATATLVTAARDTVLQALPGSFPTAADIWAYATRTLSDTGTLVTQADLVPIAKTTEIPAPVNHQTCRMSSVFGSAGHEVICWAELNGKRVPGAQLTEAIVTVLDSQGAVLWTATSTSPNSAGTFRFINPVVASADSNYLVLINIDGVESLQSYITVG